MTIVNDCFFKPDGDASEGNAVAVEFVDYFKAEVPEVELPLWLEARDNPLHHCHITGFSDPGAVQKIRDSGAIKRFVGRLYPHIDHSTFISPACDVWLVDGRGVKPVS